MLQELKPGMKVHAGDGEAGKLSRIVTDPKTRQPSYLVVRRGRLRPREVLVPASLAERADDDGVWIAAGVADLDGFPDYEVTVRKGTYERPVPLGAPRVSMVKVPPENSGFLVLRQRNVPERSVTIEKGLPVLDRHGDQIGTVQGVVVDPEKREATFLTVTPARPASPTFVVPVLLIADAGPDHVRLDVEQEHLEGLPTWR